MVWRVNIIRHPRISGGIDQSGHRVQGVNMRNNPYILGLLIILSVFLYFKEDQKPKLTSISYIKTPKIKLGIKPLVLKNSFHAHEYDQTARSLELKAGMGEKLECSFSAGRVFKSCKKGEVISWSQGAYRSDFSFIVKNQYGAKVQFSPRKHNPNISFHSCDRFLKTKTTELTLRNTIRNIQDTNKDGMKIICLDSNQEIELLDGPLIINRDVALIGTHANPPVIRSAGDFPVFKNENKTLFLYNLELETGLAGNYGLNLGVGSYLGADNLKILVSSEGGEGIHCFGCTIDGDRVSVKTLEKNSKAIFSSLGLLELRWASLVVNGESSMALKTDMGSFTNILEKSVFISNETGPAIEMVESGLYFSTGVIEQNGAGAAVYLSDLSDYIGEFQSITVNSNNIGFMIKNAKNVFLKDILINSKGARMVNLGSTRLSQN